MNKSREDFIFDELLDKYATDVFIERKSGKYFWCSFPNYNDAPSFSDRDMDNLPYDTRMEALEAAFLAVKAGY